MIAVLPSLHGRGWNGIGDFKDCAVAKLETLEQFAEPRDTDAMALMYQVPGAPAFPRLNLGAERALAAEGQSPLLHWAMFDVDNEGHIPWKDPVEAAMALAQAIEQTGFGGYTTRAGYRLIANVHPPLPVALANSFLRQVGEALPVPVDPCSYEWTRLMRLPRALRDGQVGDSLVQLGTMVCLDHTSLRYKLVESDNQIVDWGESPPEPVELTWHDWKHASDMEWLHLGQPIPPDNTGSRYNNAKSSLARIAARGNYDDPHTLASFLWASVLATEGSSLDMAELWKLAGWVAERQDAANGVVSNGEEDDLPVAVGCAPSAWKLIKPAFTGRASVLLNKLKDGVPLTDRKARYVEFTYKALRLIAEKTELPADVMYQAVHASVTTQLTPLLPDVWAKCLELVAEREGGGNDTESIAKVFCARYPLTVATPVGMLFQLNTTTTPYSYLGTSEQLIDHDFNHYTLPGLPMDVDTSGLPLRNILSRYGGRVEQATYVSGQRDARYDHTTKTITIGVHNIDRAAKPTFHPDIAKWLQLLGGTDPDGLLDWLACVTYTQTQPLCALYIEGAPGIGKTLLARGISSLWRAPSVDYNKVMNASFNAEMTSCPLLFADEGIIVNRNNMEQASQNFRNVVAGTDHYINAKYRQPIPLQAAMRVLICANDDNGLPFRESLGQEGIAAIVQRVLYVKASCKARDYLLSLGGRAGVTAWAPSDNTPGQIAEHLLWLRDNREVHRAEGQRFLVEGKETEWHRAFGARQGLKPSVLQVVYALLNILQAGMASPGVCLVAEPEAQCVWVTSNTVLQAWDTHARSYQARPAQISDALKQLAVDRKKRKFGLALRRAWALPYQAFVDAAVCEIEDLPEEST